mmetsp:Transcript_23344/g.72764  ORF Transcript_23344/g.72764 Transcript_23344/m.72764 type:complete len:215 (+) Transcript_23344:345-989(+)
MCASLCAGRGAGQALAHSSRRWWSPCWARSPGACPSPQRVCAWPTPTRRAAPSAPLNATSSPSGRARQRSRTRTQPPQRQTASTTSLTRAPSPSAQASPAPTRRCGSGRASSTTSRAPTSAWVAICAGSPGSRALASLGLFVAQWLCTFATVTSTRACTTPWTSLRARWPSSTTGRMWRRSSWARMTPLCSRRCPECWTGWASSSTSPNYRQQR